MVMKHESGSAYVVGHELELITFLQMPQGKQIITTALFHVLAEAGFFLVFILGTQHCMDY